MLASSPEIDLPLDAFFHRGEWEGLSVSRFLWWGLGPDFRVLIVSTICEVCGWQYPPQHGPSWTSPHGVCYSPDFYVIQ